MYSIQIVGAGYTGSAIAASFKEKKQKVSVLFRNPGKIDFFEKQGIQPFAVDLTRPATLEKIPDAHFIVLSAAPDERTDQAYREIYLHGIRNYLDSLKKKARPYLIVYLSSTSVWPETNGEWVDENTPAMPDSEKGKILLQAEQQVLQSGFPSVVLRLSGIYGPGRNRLQAFQEGTWPGEKQDRYLNLIHRDDIVGMMPVLFNKASEGNIYLGTDGNPALISEMMAWLAGKTGKANPFRASEKGFGGKRCRNEKLKSLGYEFKYPSFREGYQEILVTSSKSPSHQ